MQTFVWSFMTYFVLQLGAVVMMLILSGFAVVERLGYRICKIRCQFGNGKMAIRLALPFVMMAFGLFALLMENLALRNIKNSRNNMELSHNLAGIHELRARVVRHQRNWWLSLASTATWG